MWCTYSANHILQKHSNHHSTHSACYCSYTNHYKLFKYMQLALIHNFPSTRREVISWAMRKLGVEKWLVMSMYTGAVVRTHTHLTALFPGLPRWAGIRKAKPIWILLKQETVSGSGISWDICKSAPHSRQISRQHPTAQFFTGWMPFLPPNQQRQSTEGTVQQLS